MLDVLIKNTLALTPEGLLRTSIGIRESVISSFFMPEEALPEAKKVISGENLLASPALVNCHTHAYMSVFRGAADDISFSDWLFGRIMPLEDKITSDDAYWGAMLACIEMAKSGTAAFCDMHMFPFASAKAAEQTGLRAVITRGLSGSGKETSAHDSPENEISGGKRRIAEALEEMQRFAGSSLVTFMLAPHSVYTCDEEYLRKIARLSKEKKLSINIHLSESEGEVADCIAKTGKSPIAYADSLGLFDGKCIAAHCVFPTDEDMDILAQRGVYVALNARSNLKLGNGTAPVPEMMSKGIRLCLGTDGAASNNSLDLFGEMSMTSLLHKGGTRNAAAVSSREVFRFATENGAGALGIENSGTLEVGKKADIMLLNLDTPALHPLYDTYAAICYSAGRSEVESLIVDGKMVVENKKMVTIDEENIYANIRRIEKKIKDLL